MFACENECLTTGRRSVGRNLGAVGSETEARAQKLKKKSMSVVSSKTIDVLVVVVGLLFYFMYVTEVPENSEEDPYDGMDSMKTRIKEIGRKMEDEISSVRKDIDEKMKKKEHEIDTRLKILDVRSDAHLKFMVGFEKKGFLKKEEFGDFFEEFNRFSKNNGTDSNEVSVDEIRDYARQIVEKEINRHAADGLGMVDYALKSGGGKILRHSEPYGGGSGSGLAITVLLRCLSFLFSLSWRKIRLVSRNMVSVEAEKMISPSFGEPGQCFALKGTSGFVEIRLRAAIVPEAVTLEHVAKSVAHDRFDALKHCIVSGWMQGQDSTDMEIGKKKFLLTEFTYDLEKSNAQTFKVELAANILVDTIRLDFQSNHGRASHTCIYRLRVQGHHEPV